MQRPRHCWGEQGRGRLLLERTWGLLERRHLEPLGGTSPGIRNGTRGRRRRQRCALWGGCDLDATLHSGPPHPGRGRGLTAPPLDQDRVGARGDRPRFDAAIAAGTGADPRPHGRRRHDVDHGAATGLSRERDRTVTFGFDGTNYEIDLADDNADALREAFSDYIAAARKTGNRSGRASSGSAPKRGNSEELGKIREWAAANGHEVSSRGRISQAVRDAYDAAH